MQKIIIYYQISKDTWTTTSFSFFSFFFFLWLYLWNKSLCKAQEVVRFPLKWLRRTNTNTSDTDFFFSAQKLQQFLTDNNYRMDKCVLNNFYTTKQSRAETRRRNRPCKCVYTKIFPSFLINTNSFVSLLLFHLWGSIEVVSNISAPSSSNEILLLLPRLLQEKGLPRSKPFPLKPFILDETMGITKTEDA